MRLDWPSGLDTFMHCLVLEYPLREAPSAYLIKYKIV